MITKRQIRIVFIFFLIFTAASGCNLPSSNGEEPVDATNTPEVDTAERPSENTALPDATSAPDATPTTTVVHTDFPGNPAGVRSFVVDRSTKNLASERRANADNFAIGLLERPYTSEVMDYRDYIDIIRGELSLDETWLYVTIYLEGTPPDGAQVYYGLEIDNDIDGRGDWLIYGLVPPSTDWTTDGVHIYKDSNNNVGGAFPVNSEAPNSNWDGYDEQVFNQGQGPDPDAAWIRRAPNNPDRVQLALKFAQLADNQFMWSVWADEGVHEAAYFDYNDHFTLAEAGSPVLNSNDYPLKALFAVDNTCRWGFGFEPTGSEPGVCYIPPTPTPIPPTATIALGEIGGSVCLDANFSGSCNPGERWPGITVNLGSGACPSSGAGSTITNSVGVFNFTNLSAGTYCVKPQVTLGCSHIAIFPAQRTVNLSAGEEVFLTFGYQITIC